MLETIEQLGYGALSARFKKDHVFITVNDPLPANEKDNIMAKNICVLYQGIFNGFFESLNIDVDGDETECCLLESENCVFKYDLLVDEFEEEDIDPDETDESISDFLSTL